MSHIYSPHTGSDELIGMDHPLFMVRSHARICASWAASEGLPLEHALQTVPVEVDELFAGAPAALVEATIREVYALRDANRE